LNTKRDGEGDVRCGRRVEKWKEQGKNESLSRRGKKNIPLSEGFPSFARSAF